MQPADAKPARSWQMILPVAMLLCWVLVFVSVWGKSNDFLWDFKTYYFAVKVYEQGASPYEVSNLRGATAMQRILPFYYPLSALQVLRPLCNLDYTTASRVWMVSKALAMIGLLLLWRRYFLRDHAGWPLLALGLFGFGGATTWDLKAGNVSTFEQLLLWAGFALLLRSRFTAFVACVVGASVFKLTPSMFLLLLLLPSLRSRANLVRMIVGIVAVLLIALLPFVGHADRLDGLLHGLRSAHPRLQFNPTFLGALDELAVEHGVLALAGWLKYVVLAAYYVVLLGFSRRFLAHAWREGSLSSAILIAVLLYALVVPRFIIYSYMIVIVPVLALVLPAVGRTNLGRGAALIALCLGGLPILPSRIGAFLHDGMPFLLLSSCWMLLVTAEKATDA